MRRNILVIITIILLTANNVLAVGETTTQNQVQDLTQLEIKALVIEQNAKSTAEIKEFFERKTIDYNKNTQRMIDENFKVLDARQDAFLREAGFKLGAVFLSGIVAGQLIVLLIKRKIDKTAVVKKNLWDARHQENIVVPLDDVISKEQEKYSLPKVEDLPQTKKAVIKTKEQVLPTTSLTLDVRKHITPSMSEAK